MWKNKTSHQFTDRLIIFVILLIYISISHIILPAFNKSDVLFFFKWNMYSYMPNKYVYDITWDNGRSFLFRDHRQKAEKLGINIHLLFYLLKRSYRKRRVRKDFYSQLTKLCQCKNINLVKLKGSLAEHIFYKKQLEIIKQNKL